MEAQADSRTTRRRSERVSIAFPVRASGIDSSGTRFCETTKTATVSRHGCSLLIPQSLLPSQEIELHRLGTQKKGTGRIVAQIAEQADGFLYGISMDSVCEELWDIRFTAAWQEQLLESVGDGIYFVDRDRKISYWNSGAESLAGFSAGEAVGKHCYDNFLDHVDEQGNSLCNGRCPLSKAMADGEPRQSEIYLRHKRGHRVPISVRVLPVRNNGGAIVGAVEVFGSSTSKRLSERRVAELENLAFRDCLTNLANRRYLELKINQALQEHRQFNRRYGLLFLDLDKFKQINDAYGHDTGDSLLKTIGETLVESLRSIDVVGRWGGEEFLVLMPDVTAVDLSDLAERCRTQAARTSICHGASRVSVTASIGVTLLNHADCAQTAVRRADHLMYESKRAGGDRATAG